MTNTECKEYAKYHYECLKKHMQDMENNNLDPEQMLYIILGYIMAWDKKMTKLHEAEYELQV